MVDDDTPPPLTNLRKRQLRAGISTAKQSIPFWEDRNSPVMAGHARAHLARCKAELDADLERRRAEA